MNSPAAPVAVPPELAMLNVEECKQKLLNILCTFMLSEPKCDPKTLGPFDPALPLEVRRACCGRVRLDTVDFGLLHTLMTAPIGFLAPV